MTPIYSAFIADTKGRIVLLDVSDGLPAHPIPLPDDMPPPTSTPALPPAVGSNLRYG